MWQCQNQLLLPRPNLNLRLDDSAVTSNGKQPERPPASSFNPIPPLALPVNVKVGRPVPLHSPSTVPFSSLFQMTDSYVSTTSNGDAVSANGAASKMNSSTPSLPQSADPAVPPIIRKKLNGYVGFANLPNQVHRKSVRKGFQFTTMVVGTSRRHVAFCHTTPILTYPTHRRVWSG